MDLAVRCDHCQWQRTPLFLADEIDEHEEAQMRNHLRSTHPTLVIPRDLAHLVTHFRIGKAISSHFRD